MAKRTKVPSNVVKQLLNEASGKCANPGCPNKLVEFHHIKEWAVYKCHDASDMIAVCGTCHDHIHRGSLPISDSLLRRWKQIRGRISNRGQIYVEPSSMAALQIGSDLEVRSEDNSATIFDFGPGNRFEFTLEDDFFLTKCASTAPNGDLLYKVVQNRVSVSRGLEFEQRPGRFVVTAMATDSLLPGRLLAALQANWPEVATSLPKMGERYTIADLSVVEPGRIVFTGCFHDGSRTLFASEKGVIIGRGTKFAMVASLTTIVRNSCDWVFGFVSDLGRLPPNGACAFPAAF